MPVSGVSTVSTFPGSLNCGQRALTSSGPSSSYGTPAASRLVLKSPATRSRSAQSRYADCARRTYRSSP